MIHIYLRDVHCHNETDDGLSPADEIYSLVTAVNYATVPPAFDVTRYGVWTNFDKNETKHGPGISQSFWGIDGRPADLTDPAKVVFLVGLMENDDGSPDTLRGFVQGEMAASIAGTFTFDRPERITAMIRDMHTAMGTPTAIGLDQDERIGRPQELSFTRAELTAAMAGGVVTKTLEFKGDSGRYSLTFEAAGSAGVVGLTPDRSAVYRYSGSGTSWTKIGGPTAKLFGGPFGLLATKSPDGPLHRYLGGGRWEDIGGPGASFAVTRDAVYRLAPNKQAVYRYTGSGTEWTRIGGPATKLYGGGFGLVAVNPGGSIFRYLGSPERWERIGGPGAEFVVTRDTVYGLTPDKQAVYRYTGSGTNWTKVGGPATRLYGGGYGLLATRAPGGDIYRYLGQPEKWERIGGPGAEFVVTRDTVYGLTPDRQAVARYSGSGHIWTKVGGPADSIMTFGE
ncbi:tectonin domain-containing protein [Nocardia sp. NPDC058379]|uniref:tectonin domain-containing protein n=1 Tax=unclassified Nocardia TaxID=2637762 RepID=UPI00365D25DA